MAWGGKYGWTSQSLWAFRAEHCGELWLKLQKNYPSQPWKSKTKVMAVWCPVRVAVIVNSPVPHVLTWQGAKRQKVSYLVSILCLYLQKSKYQEGSRLKTHPPPEALPPHRIPLGNGRGHRYAESHLGLGKIWIHAPLTCLRWWRCCHPTKPHCGWQTNKSINIGLCTGL